MSERYLSKSEVLERVRISDPTMYRLRRRREFPDPIELSPRKIVWIESEIEAWLQSRGRSRVAPATAEAA